jgi:hypothetical protein
MEYYGKSKTVTVRIIASKGWLKEYSGQTCKAILYDDCSPQIDTEQLSPPLPKWQSCDLSDLEVLP